MRWIERVSIAYKQYKIEGGALQWNFFLTRLKELREEREVEEVT